MRILCPKRSAFSDMKMFIHAGFYYLFHNQDTGVWQKSYGDGGTSFLTEEEQFIVLEAWKNWERIRLDDDGRLSIDF